MESKLLHSIDEGGFDSSFMSKNMNYPSWVTAMCFNPLRLYGVRPAKELFIAVGGGPKFAPSIAEAGLSGPYEIAVALAQSLHECLAGLTEEMIGRQHSKVLGRYCNSTMIL